ncbi:STAS domain-containing protein [Streptomyces sp. NPDC059389]|uniref:STAS domain-containing protein n=1 Tax=Streptomyces sp. NPDC059389 TaxID=3346818 RepID=UPI0036CD42DB
MHPAPLAGELDFHTAARVEPRLAELAGSGHRNMVVDLSGISYCDSSGIELFLRPHQRCHAALRDVIERMSESGPG